VKVRCAAGLSVDPGDDSVAMDRPVKVHSAVGRAGSLPFNHVGTHVALCRTFGHLGARYGADVEASGVACGGLRWRSFWRARARADGLRLSRKV
jgi:hypothetical protein